MQRSPVMADSLVAWESTSQDPGDGGTGGTGGTGVYARNVPVSPKPSPPESRVPALTAGNQVGPALARLSGSRFVAAWASNHADKSTHDMYARILTV